MGFRAINIGREVAMALKEKVRKPHYQFLSKREKQTIDFVTPDLMLGLLEEGNYDVFNEIVGVIQNLKKVCGERAINEDHKQILRICVNLYKACEAK
jgi:hypothetical protein